MGVQCICQLEEKVEPIDFEQVSVTHIERQLKPATTLLRSLLTLQAALYAVEGLSLTIYQFTHHYPAPLSGAYYSERAGIFFLILGVVAVLILYCAVSKVSIAKTRLLLYIESVSLIGWVFIAVTGGGGWATLSLLLACIGIVVAFVRSRNLTSKAPSASKSRDDKGHSSQPFDSP